MALARWSFRDLGGPPQCFEWHLKDLRLMHVVWKFLKFLNMINMQIASDLFDAFLV